MDFARFPSCTLKCAAVALAFLGAVNAYAAPEAEPGLHSRMDCNQYEAHEKANVAFMSLADPSMHAVRLDSVFYSENRNACLASVFFTRGDATYSGILDIASNQMLWVKSYKGTSFSPVHIVAMDEAMDEKAKELQFAPVTSRSAPSSYFLSDLFDRTRNTLPAIKNALLLR